MNLKHVPLPILAATLVGSSLYGQASAPAAPAQAPGAPAAAPAGATGQAGASGQVAPSVQSGPQLTPVTTQSTTLVKPGKKGHGGATPAPAAPPKPAWMEFSLNPKKTLLLDFTEANADMVLSIFSKASGITILKDPSFKVPLTLNSATAVHLNDAFEILNTELDLNGYTLQKRGKLLVVVKPSPAPPPQMTGPAMPPPPPPDDKPILKVYKLKYTNSTQVARVINEVFTQQQLETLVKQLQGGGGFPPGQQQFGGGPQQPQPPKVVRASSEDYSNSVIVTAPKANQDQVLELINQLDMATDLPMESKIFRLEHVSADDVVEAVQNVLTANAPTGRGAGKPADQEQGFFGYYNRFGGGSSKPSSGSETAIAVKQSNSIVVSATHANMGVVADLIKSLDVVTEFVGTTTVIQLKNAKATDLATLLNAAFTKKKDQSDNDNPFFFVYSDDQNNGGKKGDHVTDINDEGKLINVRDLTGKVNIMADPNTNSLIVVTLPSNLRIIRDAITQLDKIGDQVMIETVIVEANLDKTTKLGVEWNFLQNKAFNQGGVQGAGTSTFGVQNATTPNTGLIYTLTGKNYQAFVNALQTDTRFKVLDTPRIFTSNNVKAVINVSTEQPYITSQQNATTFGGLIQNYDFKNVGVVLTVTPRVASSGMVAMDIDQAADDLQGFTSFNAPIINHREATTSAAVMDGQTIVLGGIIEHGTNTTENKIPILGDLPVLGPLFRSTSHDKTQTELLVFLTPHIVKNDADAQKLREEQQKQLSPGSQGDLHRLNLVPDPKKN